MTDVLLSAIVMLGVLAIIVLLLCVEWERDE